MFITYRKYSKYSLWAILACSLSFTSCKKALDFSPEDKLDSSKMYNTLADADAVVLGIYGQVAGLGERYIVLNELRADLIDVTQNANPYLQQVSNHEVAEDNPYADPSAFYKIIFNCNDALKNFKVMERQGKLSNTEFNQRYSDLAMLRAWLYLQLGIHFGDVPYIKNTIESVDEIKSLENYPKTTFDHLVDSLINDTKDLPYQDPYAYPTGSTLVFTTDGASTQKVFISKAHVLGELYLWKGNYYEAARSYKRLLSAEDNNSNIDYLFNFNRIGWSYFNVSFARAQEGSSLVNSLTAGWRSMFALSNTVREWNSEWNWSIPYHNSFAPGNPFIELFAKSGKYALKPSQKVIDLWNSQTNNAGIPWDPRSKLSYEVAANGDPVITKFTDNSGDVLGLLNKGGRWNINRAAGAHLRFAEAANRDGQGRLAYALANWGLISTFYYGAFTKDGGIIPGNFFELESEITHEGFGTNRTTFAESSPYYFDARDNASIVRGVWYRNSGIRGRATMPRWQFAGIEYGPGTVSGYGSVMTAFNVPQADLEDKIIEESALELAFEGERWSDLMRIAKRRHDPAFLADKVYEKLLKANNPKAGAVRSKLMDMNNWYLPFKLR